MVGAGVYFPAVDAARTPHGDGNLHEGLLGQIPQTRRSPHPLRGQENRKAAHGNFPWAAFPRLLDIILFDAPRRPCPGWS